MEKLNEPNEYKNCYVAFLDMLGFKNICCSEQFNCAMIKALFDDTELLVSNYNNSLAQVIVSKETITNSNLMIMSDSIVVSAPNTDKGLLSILYQGSFIQNMLLKNGIILRGGVAEGKFFQYNNIMFGPAMVEAYKIEAMAQYPRVVISENIIKNLKGRNYLQKGNIQKYLSQDRDSIQTQMELLIKQDNDKKFYINHLNPMEILKLSNDKIAQESIEKTIAKGLQIKDTHTKEKYEWLQNYYNQSMTFFNIPKLSAEDIGEIVKKMEKKDNKNA